MKKYALGFIFWALPLQADYEYFKPLYESATSKVELGNVVNLAVVHVDHTNYGAGSIDNNDSNKVRNHPLWGEGSLLPKIKSQTTLSNSSQFYTGLSAVAAFTKGDGDASGTSTTSNGPFHVDREEIFIGWKSGNFYNNSQDLIDFSIGDQSFKVGDSFVLGDGTSDAHRRAAYYIGPRSAFRNTAILRVNTSSIQGQLFHLSSNTNQRLMRGTDQPKTHLVGANIDYIYKDPKDDKKDLWSVSLLYFHIYKADKDFRATLSQTNRDGLHAINPRLGGFFFPFDKNIRFYAGYVEQRNNTATRKVRANAYYIEPGYIFSKMWASPLIFYRYSHFSGDSTPGDGTKRSYDPLMFSYGARDGLGTWELGEIYGYYYGSNTNATVHNFQIKLTPTEKLTVGLMYYIINFDKAQQAQSASKRAVDELNLYATLDYGWVSYTGLLGVSFPKDGMKQSLLSQNSSLSPNNVGKNTMTAVFSMTFKF